MVMKVKCRNAGNARSIRSLFELANLNNARNYNLRFLAVLKYIIWLGEVKMLTNIVIGKLKHLDFDLDNEMIQNVRVQERSLRF